MKKIFLLCLISFMVMGFGCKKEEVPEVVIEPYVEEIVEQNVLTISVLHEEMMQKYMNVHYTATTTGDVNSVQEVWKTEDKLKLVRIVDEEITTEVYIDSKARTFDIHNMEDDSWRAIEYVDGIRGGFDIITGFAAYYASDTEMTTIEMKEGKEVYKIHIVLEQQGKEITTWIEVGTLLPLFHSFVDTEKNETIETHITDYEVGNVTLSDVILLTK